MTCVDACRRPVFDPRKGERLLVHQSVVLPEWIDYNGHVNVAFYVLAFDQALDAFFDMIEFTPEYRKKYNVSTFALETHLCYLQEVHLGGPLRFEVQLLDLDAKRFHYLNYMFHNETGVLCATAEWISAHIDMSTRRMTPFRPDIMGRFEALWTAHKDMPRPVHAGRTIGIRRKI